MSVLWDIIKLKFGNQQAREMAAKALGDSGSKWAVLPLTSAIRDKEFGVRMYAVDALGKIGDRRASIPLVSVLSDQDLVSLASHAAESLAMIGEDAIPPLLLALEDYRSRSRAHEALLEICRKWKLRSPGLILDRCKHSDRDVRYTIICLLGELSRKGDERAVMPLIERLSDSCMFNRKTVAEELGKLGDARAFPPLLELVKAEDPKLRSASVESLGKLGKREALASFEEALTDIDHEVRSVAAGALLRWQWEPETSEQRAKLLIAGGRYEEATKEGWAAIKPLCFVLKSGYGSKEYCTWIRYAAEALMKIAATGDPRVIQPLVTSLMKMGASDYRLNELLRNALQRAGSAGTVDVAQSLIGAARDKEYLRSYDPAIEGALVAAGESAVGPLIELLKDADVRMRRFALCVLRIMIFQKFTEQDVAEPLIALLKDRDMECRIAAAEILRAKPDPRTVIPLISALNDAEPRVRQLAAQALGAAKDSRAVPPLIDSLSDATKLVRLAATEALREIGDSRAVAPLVHSLGDNDPHVRSETIKTLVIMGDARAVGPLLALESNIGIHSLETLLRRVVQCVENEVLQAVARLANFKFSRLVDACGPPVAEEFNFDCSSLRQLARQELIRRGIDA